jgi:hypothetical protein
MSGHGQPKQLIYPSYNNGHFDGGLRTKEVCWMHVSDGKTLYSIQNVESVQNRMQWGQCFTGEVGYHYYGRRDGDYIELLVPGKKIKSKKYVIQQMSDAQTTQ